MLGKKFLTGLFTENLTMSSLDSKDVILKNIAVWYDFRKTTVCSV